MAQHTTNPKVDAYIDKAKKWQEELKALRAILLDCGLTEELKWAKPCYTYDGANIGIIQDFKEYFALLFFKGALLKDLKGLLIKAGEKTHVSRQMRFTSVSEIEKNKAALKAYIKEAIEAEKAGLKVEPREKVAIQMPEELQKKLDKNTDLKKAFHALTPGRQKAYIYYFADPVHAKTRESRIEKSIPRILDGKGLTDR